jgi:hypothetical protein
MISGNIISRCNYKNYQMVYHGAEYGFPGMFSIDIFCSKGPVTLLRLAPPQRLT